MGVSTGPSRTRPTDTGRSDRDPQRTLHSFLFRLTGSRRVAHRIRRGLGAGADPSDPATLLRLAGLLRESGPQGPTGVDPVVAGARMLGARPDPPVHPPLEPGFEPASLEDDVKSAMPALRLGVIEWVLVAGYPIEGLVILFGVDATRIRDHLIEIIRGIGAFSPAGGPGDDPVRAVIADELDRRIGVPPGTRRGDDAPEPDVPSRERMLARQILEHLARDSRIMSFSDSRMIAQALRSPRVPPSRSARPRPGSIGSRTDSGSTDRDADREGPPGAARPGRGCRALQPAAPGGARALAPALTLFLRGRAPFGTWARAGLVAGALLLLVTGRGALAPRHGVEQVATALPGSGTALPGRNVGSFSDLHGLAGVLSSETDLTSEGEAPIHLLYHGGARALLGPGSRIRVLDHGARLESGTLDLTLPGAGSVSFRIELDDLRATATRGSLALESLPDRTATLRPDSGGLRVWVPGGRVWALEAGEALMRSGDGPWERVGRSDGTDPGSRTD